MESSVNKILLRYAATVGATILQHWKFDKEMIEVARRRDDWSGSNKSGSELTDLILVARYHSYLGTPHIKIIPPIEKIQAFKNLRLNAFTEKNSLEIVHQAQQEIDAIIAMLG